MSLLEQDDIHQIGDEPWWREAWYFEFYDPASKIAFKSYAGVFPHQERADLILHVKAEGRPPHHVMKMDYRISEQIGRERLSFGPQLLEMLEPGEKWRIRYQSEEVLVDVVFTATQSLYSWAESGIKMEVAETPSRHHDQPGRYTGFVEIDGQRYAIDCLGMRDRMWGWGGRKNWKNYLIMWAPFSEDFMLNVACHQFIDGHTELAGFIYKDGVRSVLDTAELAIEWDGKRWKNVATVRSVLTDMEKRTIEMESSPSLAVIDTAGHWPHRVDHMLFATGHHRAEGQEVHSCINWSFATYEGRPAGFSAVRPGHVAAAT